MQAKKHSYAIYHSMVDRQIREIRRSLPPSPRSALTDDQVISLSIQRFTKCENDVFFKIFAEELFWRSEESVTLFPSSAKLLTDLHGARYRLSSEGGFDLPFSTFVLAIPTGLRIGGTPMPSLLVTWMPAKDKPKFVYEPTLKRCDLEMNILGDSDEKLLSIIYQIPGEHGIYSRTLLLESDIPRLLMSRSVSQFKAALKKQGKLIDDVMLSDDDAMLQYNALKLVGSIGIYNLATDGDALKEGYPGGILPRLVGKQSTFSKPYELQGINPIVEHHQHDIPHSYYRSWYFRQLRSDRYYQGDYESRARGSRYVFVSDTIVGQNASPYLLNEDL